VTQSSRTEPFKSADEVAAYLLGDRIECLECGRFFSFLPRHITRSHQINARAYRDKWAIPASCALAGHYYREQQSAKMSRMIHDGAIVPAYSQATEAAREAGSRRKVDWQAHNHAAATAAARPGDHSRLAPGAKRADGRDADRAREYQRRRRSKHPIDTGNRE
jgi:hypothetical protein